MVISLKIPSCLLVQLKVYDSTDIYLVATRSRACVTHDCTALLITFLCPLGIICGQRLLHRVSHSPESGRTEPNPSPSIERKSHEELGNHYYLYSDSVSRAGSESQTSLPIWSPCGPLRLKWEWLSQKQTSPERKELCLPLAPLALINQPLLLTWHSLGDH